MPISALDHVDANTLTDNRTPQRGKKFQHDFHILDFRDIGKAYRIIRQEGRNDTGKRSVLVAADRHFPASRMTTIDDIGTHAPSTSNSTVPFPIGQEAPKEDSYPRIILSNLLLLSPKGCRISP